MYNTLQHPATFCNTLQHLQHTATHCNTPWCMEEPDWGANSCCCPWDSFCMYSLQHTAIYCNTLQRTATHCNTRQHTLIIGRSQSGARSCSVARGTHVTVPVYIMLQCVAVCCNVLQCVAVCCSVLHCVALCCNAGPESVPLPTGLMPWYLRILRCSVLQCVAVCCTVL